MPRYMKKSKFLFLFICVFSYGTTQILAQELSVVIDKSEVQKHTMMEQFAPDLVVPLNQRLAMKNELVAAIKRKRAILDTLDISNRKKRRLFRDLNYCPFSNRLEKATLANSKFQDVLDNTK